MKIAMIGQKGMPASVGGVERHVHELSVRLAALGHDVTAYSRTWYSKRDNHVFDGVRIFHTPGIRTKHFDAISHTLTATLHAAFHGYDVIHYHAVGPALLSWIPRLFSPNTKIVTTFHCIDRYHQKWGLFARTMLRLGEWAACRFAHETIVVSKSLQQYCVNEFHVETHYIPNGVPRPASVLTDAALQTFGLQKNKYLLVVSRLVPHKGIHLLIEAFQRLQATHADHPTIRDLKLAIVGGSSFTDDYIRDLHLRAASSNSIVFTDYQVGDALQELFAHSLAMVHPSLNEGLPIGVLEAMSYKKPVLLSNIPEHLELTNDHRVIFLQNSVEAIEQALASFIDLSAEDQQAIGERNFKTICRDYDWEKIVTAIDGVYANAKNHLVSAPAEQPNAS